MPCPTDKACLTSAQLDHEFLVRRTSGFEVVGSVGRNGGDSRNSTRAKTVLTDVGPVGIAVPRDREGSFELKIVMKRSRGWTVSDDSTINRAHRHAAGARRKGRRAMGDELEAPARSTAGQALGWSCGGLTTKVHLACDNRGLPPAVVVTPDNVNDPTVFDGAMNALRVPRRGAGRPRRRPPRRSLRTRRTRLGRSAGTRGAGASGQ